MEVTCSQVVTFYTTHKQQNIVFVSSFYLTSQFKTCLSNPASTNHRQPQQPTLPRKMFLSSSTCWSGNLISLCSGDKVWQMSPARATWQQWLGKYSKGVIRTVAGKTVSTHRSDILVMPSFV